MTPRVAVLGSLLAAGCSCASPGNGLDAAMAPDAWANDAWANDAGTRDDASVPDASPNDTGDDASLDAGVVTYASWHECGWSDPTCTCDGVLACEAVAGGTFEPLGSAQARVCGIDGADCIVDVFDETEGGGMAQRCRIPRAALACSEGIVAWGAGTCEPLFTCNLLMGDCPSDVAPGSSVIHCR